MTRGPRPTLAAHGWTGSLAVLLLLVSTPAAAQAPLASACAAVTPQSVTAQVRLLEQALGPARRDATKNGASGSYAVAARNARDLLQRSADRMKEAVAKLQVADPAVTTYAEGGEIKEMTRYTFEWISQGGHWALISAAYHRSTDARDAFEGAITALENANRLYAAAGRCFMSGFLK